MVLLDGALIAARKEWRPNVGPKCKGRIFSEKAKVL